MSSMQGNKQRTNFKTNKKNLCTGSIQCSDKIYLLCQQKPWNHWNAFLGLFDMHVMDLCLMPCFCILLKTWLGSVMKALLSEVVLAILKI